MFSLASFSSDICERDVSTVYPTVRIQLAEYKRYCHVNRNCLPFPFYGGGVDVSYETIPVNPALCFIP